MPPQSKKTKKLSSSKSTSSAKKSVQKKFSIKKKMKKKTKNSSGFKRRFFIFVGLLLIISIIGFAYFLGEKKMQGNEEISKLEVKQSKKVTVSKVSKPSVKKVGKRKKVAEKPKRVTKLAPQSRKPRLAIIIDDVHTAAQIKAIKNLHMKITPSIFPPYKLAPNSHLLTRGLEHYMIHLPMESGNKQFNKQYKTLKVSFSNRKIENRIKELRLLFPKAKYINNHTGSVFTSNYAAMHLAYKIMRENGFIFLDSKTINSSKVKEIAEAFGDIYVSRDVFIDNIHTILAIHAQLKKAVKLAKKKGYAIAIGHPHKVTMQALASAKEILREVDLVYIDGLYH